MVRERKNRKELTWVIAAFALFCIVSAYYRVSATLFPDDPIHPPVVFFIYLLLLTVWWNTIRNRVTQSNMRIFLQAEHAFMLIGITTRFLQDAFLPYYSQDVFLYQNTFIMRMSGYFTIIPMIILPLLGLYAAFGLGKAEEYRFNRKWYYLLIPAGILILLTLTNDIHFFVFRSLENAESNRNYHPNIGLYIIIAWAFTLLFIRIILIYFRGRELRDYSRLSIVPFLIAVFMLLYSVPYAYNSYVMNFELFDYHVFLFFLEAMIWEISIIAGMVPVNTRYEEVFDRSTVAMQIIGGDGRSYLKSASAPEISTWMFDLLKRETTVRTPEGQELHLYAINGGYAIWKNDVSQTIAVIDELQRSAEKLEQEGELLRQELAIRSDEAAIKEQNNIYNQLTEEIGEQLTLLRNLLRKRDSVADKTALFNQICLIGTYIKRRCNLRLALLSDGTEPGRELELCYHELSGCLKQMGVDADVLFNSASRLSPEFAVFTFDVFEFLLEYERFELHSIRAVYETDYAFSAHVHSGRAASGYMPSVELRRMSRKNYNVLCQQSGNGYQVSVRTGEA